MSREEFIKLIESIGFRLQEGYVYTYNYKEFRISFNYKYYIFYNGFVFEDNIPLNDLTPIENHFKNELRSIKLKQLLK